MFLPGDFFFAIALQHHKFSCNTIQLTNILFLKKQTSRNIFVVCYGCHDRYEKCHDSFTGGIEKCHDNLGTPRATFRLTDEDKANLATIRRRYDLHTDTAAIRLALTQLAGDMAVVPTKHRTKEVTTKAAATADSRIADVIAKYL
jgi:antirestriction protein